ncbi:nascent polypeptide-associated complex subunit beta, partial [Striga asiatica]
ILRLFVKSAQNIEVIKVDLAEAKKLSQVFISTLSTAHFHSLFTLPSYSVGSSSQLAEMNVEKLQKMAGSVRTGGKGTMRRKKKAVHKTTTTDDKRLQSTLKRIGVNAIPAIEEVNIFKDDAVIQFIFWLFVESAQNIGAIKIDLAEVLIYFVIRCKVYVQEPLSFQKMHDFSTADGFLEITEDLADMIRFAANEPSVGLFYIQQHTQNATPNVLSLRSKVSEKSQESSLHAQDLEDSMDMLRSMKECGPTITEEMIENIKRCLSIAQPKLGSAHRGTWSPATWGQNSLFTQTDGEKRASGYLSSIFRHTKQMAHSLESSQADDSSTSFLRAKEDLPLSRELQEESVPDEDLAHQRLISLCEENYDEFKADQEAKLEEWLGGKGVFISTLSTAHFHSLFTLPSYSVGSSSQLAEMNVEKLQKMAGSVRTGGKGTMRRKKKAVHKTTTTDDKRLQSTLKRIGVNAIPAIEEVNIFKDDAVIQFVNPKVQASIAANTWVVSGTPQNKKLTDILPSIIHQLGPDNLENLKKLAEQFQKQGPAAGGATSGVSGPQADDDDDEVPELVAGETFEAAADEGNTQKAS